MPPLIPAFSSMYNSFSTHQTSLLEPKMATSSPKPGVTVSLTSERNPSDVRELSMTPHSPCMIGRASRSRDKDHLAASPTNALFDCPVVSRYHAELELVRRGPDTTDIVIRDIGSLHGTKVNNMMVKEGTEVVLKDEDRVQLGEKVTRGEDSHEGVALVYRRIKPTSIQVSHTFVACEPSRVFSVPTYSDDEDDESDQSVDEYSIISEQAKQTSSAKTTPEQRKAPLGSQESPIDVDSEPPRHLSFIDLSGKEDNDIVEVQPPPQVAAQATPESHPSQATTSPQPPVEDSLRVVPETVNVNVTAYDFEPEADDAGSEVAQDSPSEDDHSIDDAEDGVDVDDHDDEESSISDHGDAASIRELEYEVVRPKHDYMYRFPKEPSPELGSPIDVASFGVASQPNTGCHPTSEFHNVASQPSPSQAFPAPRYENPRSTDPYATYPEHVPLQVPVAPRPSHSTCASPPHASMDYANIPSRRWDVRPSPPQWPAELRSTGQYYNFTPLHFNPMASHNMEGLRPAPYPSAWSREHLSFPAVGPAGHQPHGLRNTRAGPINPNPSRVHDFTTPATGFERPGDVESKKTRTTDAVLTTPTNKIYISDIVEDTIAAAVTAAVDSEVRKETAEPTTPDPVVPQKRKAAEMLASEINVDELVVSNTSSQEVVPPQSEHDPETPAAKRGRVAGVATVAGGIVAGSVATMAFLISPLAEKAIEWLA